MGAVEILILRELLQLRCALMLGSRDYCLADLFEAGCPDNQVIIMMVGKYGRMQMGNCVRTDFGFLGCSTEVIKIMDMRCSGRRKCSFMVPDPLFEKFAGTKCNTEFKSYLEASFICVPGIAPVIVGGLLLGSDFFRATFTVSKHWKTAIKKKKTNRATMTSRLISLSIIKFTN